MLTERDVIARHDDLHFVHARPVDQHAIGAAQIFQRDLSIIDDEARVPPGDQRIVQNQLAPLSAPDDRHAGGELEVSLVLETQPDSCPQSVTAHWQTD
jgi:hypothetical protein